MVLGCECTGIAFSVVVVIVVLCSGDGDGFAGTGGCVVLGASATFCRRIGECVCTGVGVGVGVGDDFCDFERLYVDWLKVIEGANDAARITAMVTRVIMRIGVS